MDQEVDVNASNADSRSQCESSCRDQQVHAYLMLTMNRHCINPVASRIIYRKCIISIQRTVGTCWRTCASISHNPRLSLLRCSTPQYQALTAVKQSFSRSADDPCLGNPRCRRRDSTYPHLSKSLILKDIKRRSRPRGGTPVALLARHGISGPREVFRAPLWPAGL